MAYYKCGSIHPTQNSNVVVDTASGVIANFQTPLAMPLVKTRFDVNAVQDLHGYDHPWPAGGGKNLFDMNSAVSGYINGTGDVISNPDKENMTSDFIPVTPSAKYVYSFYPTVAKEQWTGWAFYSEKDMKTVIGRRNASYYSSEPILITIPEGAHYIRIGSRYLSGGRAQFEEGSSATSWTPYENICPITGHDEVNIYHSGEDTSNPDEITITLGQTVYGGTINLTTGLLRLTKGKVVLNGSESWIKSGTYSGGYYISNWAVAYSIPQTSDHIQNILKTVGTATEYGQTLYCCYFDRSISIRVDNDLYPTVEDFKTWLSNNNVECVYPLKTPIEIQLTAQEIEAFIGTNIIYADTGNTSLQFRKIG